MNVENIKKVIEEIREEDNHFSMARFGVIADDDVFPKSHVICETASCICGWANSIANDFVPLNFRQMSNTDNATEWLGLDDMVGDQLFYGYVTEVGEADISNVTRQEAIKTLENLIETGTVDWSHCKTFVKYENMGIGE